MKTYSLSAAILLAILLSTSLSSFRFDDVTTTLKKGRGSSNYVLSSPLISKYVLSGSLSGNYPANQGYHNYGSYTLDLSNFSDGSNFAINFSAENVPNRITVTDGVGNSWSSHNNSSYNSSPSGSPVSGDPYNGWVGYTSNPGPWGSSGITGPTTGSFSVTKVSGRTYTLQVETVTNSSTDYWSLTY